MNKIYIRVFTRKPEESIYEQVWQLREDVLRKPLGLSLEDEDLSAEADQTLFVALQMVHGVKRVEGCLMMVADEKAHKAKLRQMAVSPLAQGAGIGKMLMKEAELYCRSNGFRTIVLHARISAAGFYEKLGYGREGAEFTEVTIPHVLMKKTPGA